MKFELSSIFIQDENGNLILSAGSIGKDPSLITGYVSALEGMGKELSQRTVEDEEAKFKYHDFGENLTLLMKKVNEVIFYIVLNRLPPDQVAFLKKFLSSLVELFAECAGENFELPFSPLLEEDFNAYTRKVALLLTRRPWFRKIRLTENYLLSDAGILLLKFLWKKVVVKTEHNLGKGVTELLVRKVNSKARAVVDSPTKVDLQRKEQKVTPKLTFPSDKLEESVYFYSIAFKYMLEKIRRGLGEEAFQRFDVFNLGPQFSANI